MNSSRTLLWNSFLEECQLLTEKETGKPHQWETIPTKKQKEDILEELFMKRASLEEIVFRHKILKKYKS